MRSIFSGSRRVAAACVLIVVLAAPSAFASGSTSPSNLWTEFLAWFAGRIDVPNGVTAADGDSFTQWLMGRIGVPGG